jgi:hypothetical protein
MSEAHYSLLKLNDWLTTTTTTRLLAKCLKHQTFVEITFEDLKVTSHL